MIESSKRLFEHCITAGETFYLRRNYELLNYLFQKNYRAWMKCTFHLNYSKFIWMVTIDGKERNGWIDTWQNGKIIEQYVDTYSEPSNLDEGFNAKQRIVFEKCNDAHGNYFIFRGIFQLEKGSSRRHRVLHCISEKFYY